MPDQSFCPECPRALLCMNLHEDCIMPLATCVLCGKVISLSILTELDLNDLFEGKARITGREEDPQLVPPRRTVCPRLWLFEDSEMFPKGTGNRFTCHKCENRGFLEAANGLWDPTHAKRR